MAKQQINTSQQPNIARQDNTSNTAPAGASANPIFLSLPITPSSSMSRIGYGSAYNGGTAMVGSRVILNIVANSSGSNVYLACDDSNILGSMQSNPNRYIYVNFTYEAA